MSTDVDTVTEFDPLEGIGLKSSSPGSGGLIAVWMPSSMEVSLLYADNQVMHLFITIANDKSWLTSLVYGSNIDYIRNSLWERLAMLDASKFPISTS